MKVHSGRKHHPLNAKLEEAIDQAGGRPDEFLHGRILGFMHVYECTRIVPEDDLLASGPVCWKIDGVCKIEDPTLHRGQLGLWKLPGYLEDVAETL